MKIKNRARDWVSEAAVILTLTALVPFANARNIALLEDKVYMDQLIWWNAGATARIWGCGRCQIGDLACSLGAAMASDVGIPCGYVDKRADYYGYNDIDDRKHGENPAYYRFDGTYDNKMDFESGRPDWSLINDSIESIQTNISAYFIREARWKGPPFWLNIDKTKPAGRVNVDFQTWLMPCNSRAKFDCWWTLCQRMSTADCRCDNSNTTWGSMPNVDDCYNQSCTLSSGEEEDCWIYNHICKEDKWIDKTCMSYDSYGHCKQCDSFGGSDKFNTKMPGAFRQWECHPIDPSYNPIDWQGYCGFGGSIKETEEYETTRYNYSEYPRRNASGADLNDDVENAVPPFTSREYWGTMPHVLGGADDDLVRDRYWLRNATDTEFLGTRTGYCSNETDGDPLSCIEYIDPLNDQRDQYDRPISRQHDPCRRCEKNFDFEYNVTYVGHNVNHTVCPDECFNYDLRYYRQPNVNSLFAYVLGITPELDTAYVGMPPNNILPNQASQCIGKSSGTHVCRTGEDGTKQIGEPCGNTKECIGGMICTGFLNTPDDNKHCCPVGTYYWEDSTSACCRNKDSHVCSQLVLDCPPGKRQDASTDRWDEFNNDNLNGWLKENFYGVEPDGKYLFGPAEKGCIGDEDCATLKYPTNLKDDITQHCSSANPGTTKEGCPTTTTTTLPGQHCDSLPCGRVYTFPCDRPEWGDICGECGGTCPDGEVCTYTEADLGPCGCFPAANPCHEDTFGGSCVGDCAVAPVNHGNCQSQPSDTGINNLCTGCYCYGKPAIYLYPTEQEQINVSLSVLDGQVVVSDPPYGSGWRVSASPDGRIDGRYDYLFYEAESNAPAPQAGEGWVVPRGGIREWFETNLPKMGLNAKETMDFTDYWVPMLKSGKYYKITRIRQADLDEAVALDVSPRPDTVIRVNLLIKALDGPENMTEPPIAGQERRGFTVVEWGVTFADSCGRMAWL